MNYLDSRPNSHRLFSEKDHPIVLDKAAYLGYSDSTENQARKYSLVRSFSQQRNQSHVHIGVYSVDSKEEYLTKEGIMKIRNSIKIYKR